VTLLNNIKDIIDEVLRTRLTFTEFKYRKIREIHE
jgi:hypothetical protein